MKKKTHPNLIKASNLILLSALIGLIAYLFVGPFTTLVISAMIFGVAIVIGMAFLARQGSEWFKWLYLILFVWGLFLINKTLLPMFHSNLIGACISLLNYIIQIVAIVLLFKVPKQPPFSAEDYDRLMNENK